MNIRRQSSINYPIVFRMVESTDHITGKTGLSPVVAISKNGGAFASPAGAVVEIGNGWYALADNATDRDTLGALVLHAEATGADPADLACTIVPFDPFDGDRLGLADLANIDSTSTEATTLAEAVELLLAALAGKTAYDAETGVLTIYARDGETVLRTITITGQGTRDIGSQA